MKQDHVMPLATQQQTYYDREKESDFMKKQVRKTKQKWKKPKKKRGGWGSF